MLYLESVRYSHKVAWRNVVAGQRVPMELTSLGRAWLAVAPKDTRRSLCELFEQRRTSTWKSLSKDIAQAATSVRDKGFCWASWQPQVVALATPIVVPGHPIYVLNMSVAADIDPAEVVDRLQTPLLNLAKLLTEAVRHL
jgi:DNA-binding IclR family transcriptional regulator